MAGASFAAKLTAWQRRHGRHGLPWQGTRDPYAIWISEIMLQQTQVGAVIPYYLRFLQKFPTVQALAAADEDEVLQLWSGLGYYSRARHLLAAARTIAAKGFPRNARALAELPGVGRSTAAAVAAFAFGERAAILDGNVKRVLARRFAVAGDRQLWMLAERLLPERDIEAYTQGLMDLGATVCTRAPTCAACPLRRECIARREGRTGEFPARPARKPLPSRTWRWLVLHDRGEFLLEKRPSRGIWGGLWTFPQLSERDPVKHCRAHLGVTAQPVRELEPLAHGFTHFRLTIRPLLCEVSHRCHTSAQAPGRMWADLRRASGAALPAPMRKLLLRLSREQERAESL